jgi:CRISPR-associated protein Cas1
MRSLYLDRRDAELDLEGGAIVVRVAGACVARIPPRGLERVVVRGARAIGTRLLATLWEQDTGLLVLSGRHGTPTARLLGRGHGDARIRLRQYELGLDPAERLALSRELVRAKLHAQRRLLLRLAARRPEARRALLGGAERIAAAWNSAGAATHRDALLGQEGAAAAAYVEALTAVFPPALGFTGRNRRPPRDPVNAVLSLGYTLLHHEAARIAQIRGLDPLLGVLHEPSPGRESLASDLIEPLRPHVDALAVELFAARTLRADHFTRDGDACLLGKAGRQAFYAAWDEAIPALSRLLGRSAAAFVRRLRGEDL